MKLMPQFESQVPDPLGDQLPALLSPGRMADPAVGIDLLVLSRERRLKGPAMQVQLDHIAGREGVLGQLRAEEFVDHPRACHSNGALLLPGGMRGDDHATEHTIGPHRDLGAIVEAAHHLAFRALLDLVGRQVQPGLNERMVEQAIVFPARHKREPSDIREDRSIAILPVKPDQRTFW
jgi:hypothetical protein